MVFEDCIGLNTDEAIERIHLNHPLLKIIINPTMSPRYKGKVCLSMAKVVRQSYVEGVLELTVVMMD